MNLRHSFKNAIDGIKIHKLRSALTILGIVIGITAIILVTSLGQGAQNLIINQIQGMGSKTIVILPGRQPKGPFDVAQTLFGDSLKERDMTALKKKENIPNLDKIMPVVFGTDVALYQGETYRLTLLGASELITQIFDLQTSQGNFFNDEDIKNRADVVVLGAKVKKELFGESDALGEKIKIKNRSFRVIGVLPAKGQVSFFNFDEIALIPYTTAQQYIFGIKYFHRLIVEADSEKTVNQAVRDITATLRTLHNITNPEKDDFHIETPADIAARLTVVTGVLTIFLAMVAAISLLVGGIGVMNIMLVSVTERTREIGLRKALGATSQDILTQFLVETIILTGIGGLIGVSLGAGLSYLVSFIISKMVSLGWTFAFPVTAALIGLAVSSVVGLIFGLYPARQASLKSPIEALRYE